MRRRDFRYSPEAANDLADVWELIYRNDGEARAGGVHANIEAFCRSLEEFPEVGTRRDEQLPGLRMEKLHLGYTIEASRPEALRTSGSAAKPVYDDGEGHLITFAPTGAGKGVSCIIPALLSWPGPVIVIDPKGENYAVTAAHRLAMGDRVAVLDPFNVTSARAKDRLNPLDLVDIQGPHATDDAAVIAKLICKDGVLRTDPFWDERAESLITGLILYILSKPKATRRSLTEVGHFIEESQSEHFHMSLHMQNMHPNGDAIRMAGNILSLASNRTRVSIITTASSHLAFQRSTPVQDATCKSTISLDDVQAGAPLAIYLVLPPDKLLSHGKLLRLWLGVLMTALSRRRKLPELPTLLLIDEAAQLGPMDELRSAVTLMRGYGLRAWSFWQDLSQLQRTYAIDWKSLVNNCSVQQYFGVSAPQAAAELEGYLGALPVRPLSQLKPQDALLIRRGATPEIARRTDYRTDPRYRKLASPNPFYAGNRYDTPLIEELRSTLRRTPSKRSNVVKLHDER